MIGREHIDITIEQSVPKHVRMIPCANRRIHFQERTDFGHVLWLPQQVVRPCLGGHSYASCLGVPYQECSLFRAHMKNMQPGPKAFGEEQRMCDGFSFAESRSR